MQKPKIQLLIKDSYLAMIKNSIGSKMFKNFYGKINNRKKDLTNNGEYSCAFFVSTILLRFKLIKEPHLTVRGIVKDMKKSGWQEIKKPKVGSVIVWEENNSHHPHIGFYIGNNKTISNHHKTGKIYVHGYKYRKIESIWWHKKIL